MSVSIMTKGGGGGVGYQWWLGALKKAKTVYERKIASAMLTWDQAQFKRFSYILSNGYR